MKDKFILTAVHGRPSTKLAFSTMGSESLLIQRRRAKGNEYYRVFKDRETLCTKITNNEKYLFEYKQTGILSEGSIIIRWGTREPLNTDNHTIVYNRSNDLAKATNKKLSREIFIASGVNRPVLVTPGNFQTSYLPIIARPITHSKGRNFVVLRSEHEFLEHYHDGWYYSNFIDKDREFRVHCAHGKVLAVMEKPNPNNGNIAWNRAQNDTDPFVYIPWNTLDAEHLRPVLVEALKAIEAVGLDFGGVDVMMAKDVPYVLEINTAPTLNSSPYVAKKFGMYFDWLFREETRRSHWEDIIDRELAKSMIWKNRQLNDENVE